MLRLPLGTRQLVVVGKSDSPDLREMSRRYVTAAASSGDTVELIEDDGDHFAVIDPRSRIWQRAVGVITEVLGAWASNRKDPLARVGDSALQLRPR